MLTVFIDSSIYIKSSFNFNSIDFRKLEALVNSKEVKIIVPNLVLMEIRNYINRYFDGTISPLLKKVLSDRIAKSCDTGSLNGIKYFHENGKKEALAPSGDSPVRLDNHKYEPAEGL